MYTIAYKWRLSTTRYAYITSTQYRVDGSEPDYTLAQIPATGKLDDATEQIIKDIVRNMSADEYRQCFENMLEKIANDKDGQYIKLKNWEYYYHFNTNENGDEKVFFVDATASATISNDGEAHAEVINDRGTLKFTFQIPQGTNGRDGVDGKDGAPGVPVNDGKYVESIYKLTKTNIAPLIKLDDDWDIEGSEYQTNDYKPNGWTDRPSGITSIYKYEWVSTRKYDLVKKLWGEFSDPAIMSRWGEDGKDGDGIEYIYKRTTDEVNPGAPTVADWEDENSDYQTNDEYAKFLEHLGWTDEPVGTEKNGYKFEWVSVRKQKDGVWQQFSKPALWSSYGKDGDDVEYIYFLNNDNEVPSFDDYQIDSDEYQSEDFRPKTNNVSWTDNYQSPTYEKRFSWISSRRKRDGKWLDFTGTTLFNVYKIGGKAYVDLYTRSNTRINDLNLPRYDGNIYYSFKSDRFYSDNNLTSEITTVNGLNNTVWYTDMPADNTAKMLFKTSALIEVKNDFDEIVAIPESSWYGPYLISSNGENASNQTPYITLNDNSLSLPINENNKPHKEYLHSLIGKLMVSDNEATITKASITTSSSKNITINNNSENINKELNELNLSFTINKDEDFTNIGIIYITLTGLYEDKEVTATVQYKIIPFYSDNAVAYKMLLNQNSVFVPDNACEILPDGGIWNTQITAHVIDDKGEDVTVGDLLYEYEANKYKSFKDNNPTGITGTISLIGCNNEEYIANGYELIQSLPNPLRLIYKINGKTLEIGYVDFNNMPKDGKNGISTRTIFAYCSTEEGITPKTPSGGTVDFTNNIVTYPEGVDVNGDAVIWGSSIPLTGVVWLSTCEFSSDTSDGYWSTPARLTGFKGAAGVSAYHLELTNDMDQVYTTDDNVVIKGQKVETIVSILNGNTPMYITADSITATSVNGFNVFKENVKNDSTNTEVKITFELTGTTLTAKTINFNISVDGDNYGTTNFDFVKTFKINNLNGTVDYDLDVTPTFIKKDKTGKYSSDEVNIKITKRDLAVDAKNITIADVIPSGYSLYYRINDNDFKEVTNYNSGYNIILSTFNTIINKITIILCNSKEYNINNIVDIAYIECVSDGVDGSAYHLELTNELEQVYTINGKCLPNQSGSTEALLFNGTASANIKSLSVSNEYNSICTASTINNKTVKIQFKDNVEINDKVLNFKVSATTEEDNIIEKTFKYIVLEGNKDYDLKSSHSYIKRVGDILSTTAITFTVTESTIGTHERKIETLTTLQGATLPGELSFEFEIGSVRIRSNKFNGFDKISLKGDKYVLDLNDYIDKFKNGEKLKAKLLSGTTSVDYIEIETISDGIDGLSQIVDLSNDYDQLYVTDGVVAKKQDIETTVYLTNGLGKFDINTGDTKIYLENEDITNNIDKVKDGKGVKLTFNFEPGDAFKKNELVYTIKVKYGENTFEKTFKIIVLNGTKDYDLDINPTIVRKNKYGNYIPSSLTLNVIESNISTTNRNSTKIGVLPTGYTLQYFVDNVNHGTPYTLNGINSEFNFEVLKPNSYIRFELNSGDTPIDYAIVECVSDGVDGSAYHLELSNEFDQVYTINKKILPGQTGITTTVQLFNGTQSASISDLAVTNFDGISTTGISGNTVSISFNEGAKTEEKEYVYKISGKTPEGDDVEKDFKIIVLNGNKDYDLHSTHTYVKKYGDNIVDSSITITVLESIVGTNDRTKTTLNSLPERMKIEVFVDGNELTDISYNSGITLNLASYSLQYQIVVNLLFKNDPDPIDSIVIEVIKDGKDGVDGKSPYHIELSNDMDQVLTVDGIVKYEQEVSTILSLYYGSSKDTGLTINHIDLPDVTGFTIIGETVDNKDDKGDVKIIIKPNIGATLEVGKNYEFPIGINQDKTNLNFNIEKLFKTVVLNTSIDYDLFVSNGIIKKTVNGYDTSEINIKVKKTDISRGDRSITYLNSLDNTNLRIDIIKDNNLETRITGITYDENGSILNTTQLSANTNTIIQLLKKNDNNDDFTLIDESIVEVVSDGKNGDPGQDGTNIEFIYKLFKDEADFRGANNIFPNDSGITGTTKEDVINQLNTIINDNSIPQWSDSPCGITNDYKIEVSSQRIKELGEKEWGAWSNAFIWSKWGEDGIDGDGVEYIFQITNREDKPTNPVASIKKIVDGITEPKEKEVLLTIINTFDFYPGNGWFNTNKKYVNEICEKAGVEPVKISGLFNDLNWTDNPQNVGPYKPVEWVSIRRKKVNLDGTFEYIYTDPTIWAEWKRDTYNSLTEFMFTIYDSRVDLSNAIVSGGTWKDISNGDIYEVVKTLSGNTKELTGITWYDSVPNHNAYTQNVWMVKGFASGEITYTGDTDNSGITYSEVNWTSPTKLIDNQHLQVEYGVGVSVNGVLVTPKPINLQEIVSGLGLNYDYTELENGFRKADKGVNYGTEEEPIYYNFEWTDNPTGITPTWMITSTFYNGKWSDWVVNKIKGEDGKPGAKGETGQSIQIKGSFETLKQLQSAYTYFISDNKDGNPPSKYFTDSKLVVGDSYIVNESKIGDETYYGYLYVYVKEDKDFDAAWESVGQIKGDSSYIYIAYANSVTIGKDNIKYYHLTEGGKYEDDKDYYGTTPGKYIGIHVATQQYEGHPHPPKLYSGSTVADSDNNGSEKLFMWSKWEGEDGFGQEQIFILSGETAPKVPTFKDYQRIQPDITISDWNASDFVPTRMRWSDVPLTTSGSDNERCCWMATRRFPVKDNTIPNEFVGESGGTAILFSYYASDGNDGESPIHVELSNEMEQIYTIDNVVNFTQTASTIITVYSGGTQINNFKVNDYDAIDGEYKYTKVYSGTTTFDKNEEKIEIKVTVNGNDITRYFKVIKLNGTKDYDLDVTPTYLRVNKQGELTYTEPISVKVTESEIGSTNVAKKTIDIDGTGLKVIYTYDAQNTENYFTGGTDNKISVTGFSNYCKIWLVNESGVTLDSVQVEKLYDGTDGQPGASGKSPFHIELSNEFDLISVVNGYVNGKQKYETSFELWEGDVDRTSAITSITITNIGDGLIVDTGLTAFTLTFNDGYRLNETIYGDLKVKTTNGKSHHRTFTIKPINDSTIHQLQVDTGYVVNGENSRINISAVTKTNSGVILIPDNIDKKIEIKEGSKTLTATTNTYTYNYSGGTNDIVINLYINNEIYDYVLIEAKNDIKPSGTLNINPLNQVVYVEKIEGTENKYKPLVSSVTFDASFVYEGVEMPVSGINISVGGSANDFSGTPVISDYNIEAVYLNELTTDSLTKERYIFETKYGNDTYYNNFFITYVEPKLDVWVDGDCIYIPDDYKGGLSKEFIFEAKFENSNVTHDCKIEVEDYTGITFNLRSNCWYINIPSEITSDNEITGFTINFTYDGISTSKEVTIIRRGKNSENWYINVFPKYLSINVGEPINLYITKNNYNGEYISLENALGQNMKLYYIIDGECVNVDENGLEKKAYEICYSDNLEKAPKEHGNNVFYPNGYLITSITTSITEDNKVEEITITDYTQEPIYSSIEFKLYYEPDNSPKELVASEKVERFDVIRNSEPTRMPASGLKIDIKDLFEDYDSKKYDIVIKEIKK